MAKLWYLVAHGSAAKILEVEKAADTIRTVKEFQHTKSTLKGEDLSSDRPGRSFSSHGASRHAMEPPQNPKEQELGNFAKEITSFLETSLKENLFKYLILVSSPALLGKLRETQSTNLKKCLKGELDKDLYSSNLNDEDLINKIREDLNLI